MTDTKVSLKDTGKRRVESATPEETDIVNSGNVVNLNGVEVTWTNKGLISKGGELSRLNSESSSSKYTYGEIDFMGVEQPVIRLRGVIDLDKVADKAVIKYLVEMTETKGYKEFAGDLPTIIHNGPIPVRVSDVSLIQLAQDNIVNYTINLVVTK